MKFEKVFLRKDEDYMTLNVLLKITGIIATGGMAKAYLSECPVKVNGEMENRRGRKLYPDDKIEVEGHTYIVVRDDR